MSDFDEIRKEVAIKHGFVLDKDDPVLVTVTLNELMLLRHVEALLAKNEAQEEKFRKKLVDALDLTVQKSQRIGENIVKGSAELIGNRADKAFTEALQEAADKIKRDWTLAQKKEREKINVFWYGWVGGTAFVFLLVAALRWMGGL